MCDRVQPIGEIVCSSCRDSLKKVQSPFCNKCGKILADEREEYCSDCNAGIHIYTEGRALYEYPCIRKSIYRFKYKGRREYAEFYGKELAEHLGLIIKSGQPEALIPVPLHSSRKQSRGYNQAELLAKALGKQLGIPVISHIVKRVKKTVPQKKLSQVQRQNNLKRAFKIIRNDVKLNTIIIIDDIYTTGSTIDSMSAVLKEAGIKNIYFIALAIGRG